MELDFITEHLNGATDRRQTLKRLGLGAAGLAGLNFLNLSARGQEVNAAAATSEDIAVLQFALNLEYLEAEFYTYATTGHGIEQAGVPIGGQGPSGPTVVKPNSQVPFADQDVHQFAREIARDERRHVLFIARRYRRLARPRWRNRRSISTIAGMCWRRLPALGAGSIRLQNDVAFLLGGFVFEDVGVTAYRGAAPLLTNKAVLSGAAGLLGTEAYHAANIRTVLYLQHSQQIIADTINISNLRDALDRDGDKDQPIVPNGQANIVPTNPNGLVFARTARQVLNIVYFAPGANAGGFFPYGINAGA